MSAFVVPLMDALRRGRWPICGVIAAFETNFEIRKMGVLRPHYYYYYYYYYLDVSCHRPFLPGTSLEPGMIPTAQALSFTLQYFPYYV